jgi:hypothetical protein
MTNNSIEIQSSYYGECDSMLKFIVKDEVTKNYIITSWSSCVLMQIKNTNHALSRYHTRLAKSPRRLDPWNTENYHCTLIIETLYISITPDLRPPGGNYVILCNFVFDYKLQHRITFPVIRRLDLEEILLILCDNVITHD